MKRYDLFDVYHNDPFEYPNKDGKWVKYEDAKILMEALVWAVTHYKLVNTDGIFEHLKSVYNKVKGE